MPELPEVEAVVRTLRPLVQGRKIRCVHVLHPIATKPQDPAQVARQAQGRRIRIVDRQGKYVLLVLDRGLLTMHFRLDGQLLWFSNGQELRERANQVKTACTSMLPSNWTKASSASPIAAILATFTSGNPLMIALASTPWASTPSRAISPPTALPHCSPRPSVR